MSALQRKSPCKGWTIVEMMVVFIIMTVIMSALVMTLRVGDMAMDIGSERVSLQTDTQTLTDWLSRDLRQAITWEIFNNTPATDYLKFNVWFWNNTSLARERSDEYIEYDYDSAVDVLTRRRIVDDTVVNEWNFSNITMAPFYTSYTNESINDFNSALLEYPGVVIIAVKKEKTVRNRPLSVTMVEEVKLRNE